jgi:cell division protein FtsI/penicillin-binding protein 2
LPGADAAFVPPEEAWARGRGLLLAAGLGGMRATPLHLAAAHAAIASGGTFTPPTPGGTGKPSRVLSERTAAQVAAMLEAAVQEGSGQGAAVPGLRTAGKTGTAVSGADPKRLWGHFVGFAPADAPRWVVCVSAEVPEGSYAGGAVAAPAFARIVTALQAGEAQAP